MLCFVVGWPKHTTKCKHEAKTIRGQIHGGQDCRLVPESIENIEGLRESDNN